MWTRWFWFACSLFLDSFLGVKGLFYRSSPPIGTRCSQIGGHLFGLYPRAWIVGRSVQWTCECLDEISTSCYSKLSRLVSCKIVVFWPIRRRGFLCHCYFCWYLDGRGTCPPCWKEGVVYLFSPFQTENDATPKCRALGRNISIPYWLESTMVKWLQTVLPIVNYHFASAIFFYFFPYSRLRRIIQ